MHYLPGAAFVTTLTQRYTKPGQRKRTKVAREKNKVYYDILVYVSSVVWVFLLHGTKVARIKKNVT